MKARMLFGASLFFLALMLLNGYCYSEEKYVPKPDEELYGTWTNEENFGFVPQPQKVVNTPPNICKAYNGISDSDPYEESRWDIDSKWTDSEGNVWYKIFRTVSNISEKSGWQGLNYQELHKFSKSATVWERVGVELQYEVEYSNPQYYPQKIDPKDPSYCILYRTGK
jgi:hypothetical protein